MRENPRLYARRELEEEEKAAGRENCALASRHGPRGGGAGWLGNELRSEQVSGAHKFRPSLALAVPFDFYVPDLIEVSYKSKFDLKADLRNGLES